MSFASIAGVHGASWPSASTRSPAAPWDPRLPSSDQRQGLCFIRTMLSGWAYGAIYRNGDERTAALDGWLWHHNCQRSSASATSPRSLVLTREEPTFSGLTPRSHGRAFEAARFADRARREQEQAKQWSAGDSTTPAYPTRSN